MDQVELIFDIYQAVRYIFIGYVWAAVGNKLINKTTQSTSNQNYNSIKMYQSYVSFKQWLHTLQVKQILYIIKIYN